MAVRPILVLGNPVLRNKARKISRFDQSLERLVQDMIETMREAPGVGLAAPQIGVPLQVAVVEAEKDQVHVLVNPEILKIDGEWEPDEGCLSVPGYWAKIKRGARVTVKARDAKGRELRVTGERPALPRPTRKPRRAASLQPRARAARPYGAESRLTGDPFA